MKQPNAGAGQWRGYALLVFLLLVWGVLGFGFGVAWAVTAPVCSQDVAPWVLAAWN